MKLLIVSATISEIVPLINDLGPSHSKYRQLYSYAYNKKSVDVLITGIGIAATAYHLGKTLAKWHYDFVLNLGIAGSFNKDIAIGDIVNVTQDRFADLGAEDNDGFLSLTDMGLQPEDKYPFTKGVLLNNTTRNNTVFSNLPTVLGITVNKVLGKKESIDYIKNRYHPDIESMEGAAFLYACLYEKINCVQIRAVSNYVEPRNKDNWEIESAIKSLNEKAIDIIKNLK